MLMNTLFAFFDRLQTAFGTTPPYLQVVLKALFAVAGSLVVWFILKRILASFRKKTQNQDFIQINAQVYNLIEKAFKAIADECQTATGEMLAFHPRPVQT